VIASLFAGDEFERNGRSVEYKTYIAMMTQIWSLLPGFCTCPTDLADVSCVTTKFTNCEV